MARFGMLVLRGGRLVEEGIVDSSWLAKSTAPALRVSGEFSYGFQWWLLPVTNIAGHVQQPNDIRFAWGYGGQFIFVVPWLDLIVVSTGANFTGNTDQNAISFLRLSIIPSVRN
jgi:CubicO group peptidase (beta-lactamase class C family)